MYMMIANIIMLIPTSILIYLLILIILQDNFIKGFILPKICYFIIIGYLYEITCLVAASVTNYYYNRAPSSQSLTVFLAFYFAFLFLCLSIQFINVQKYPYYQIIRIRLYNFHPWFCKNIPNLLLIVLVVSIFVFILPGNVIHMLLFIDVDSVQQMLSSCLTLLLPAVTCVVVAVMSQFYSTNFSDHFIH